MSISKLFPLVLASVCMVSACGQEETIPKTPKQDEGKQVAQTRYHEPHPFGGWFCPDNLNGFPPVDIQDLDKIPVVEGRLPTKEETQSSASLMFIDPAEYPNARALDIDLPQLATIYSEHSDMEELIIVIQAVVIDEDTIVGYRFPNGGNGSAWFDQVTFLNPNSVSNFGSQPFVFETIEISATTAEIWRAFSTTEYARKLGKRFDQQEFFTTEWKHYSMARLQYELPGERAKGLISNVFGSLYLHIDYDLNGVHYTEKLLVLEDKANQKSKLLVVAGPFTKDFNGNQQAWKNMTAQVKAWCEGYSK